MANWEKNDHVLQAEQVKWVETALDEAFHHPGAHVSAQDAERQRMRELNNNLHNKHILEDMNIIGMDKGHHLILADNAIGGKRHGYQVDVQGSVSDIYNISDDHSRSKFSKDKVAPQHGLEQTPGRTVPSPYQFLNPRGESDTGWKVYRDGTRAVQVEDANHSVAKFTYGKDGLVNGATIHPGASDQETFIPDGNGFTIHKKDGSIETDPSTDKPIRVSGIRVDPRDGDFYYRNENGWVTERKADGSIIDRNEHHQIGNIKVQAKDGSWTNIRMEYPDAESQRPNRLVFSDSNGTDSWSLEERYEQQQHVWQIRHGMYPVSSSFFPSVVPPYVQNLFDGASLAGLKLDQSTGDLSFGHTGNDVNATLHTDGTVDTYKLQDGTVHIRKSERPAHIAF